MENLQAKVKELRDQGLSFGEIAKRLGISKASAYRYYKSGTGVEDKIEETEDDKSEELSEYLVESEDKLKVKSVDDVVKKINEQITVVPEEEIEEEESEESITAKIPKGNIWTLITIIAIVAVAGIVVYYFFIRKPDTQQQQVVVQPVIQSPPPPPPKEEKKYYTPEPKKMSNEYVIF